jgi:hypothetical protein
MTKTDKPTDEEIEMTDEEIETRLLESFNEFIQGHLKETFTAIRAAQSANLKLEKQGHPDAINVSELMRDMFEAVCVNMYSMVRPEHRDDFCKQLQKVAAEAVTITHEWEAEREGKQSGHA